MKKKPSLMNWFLRFFLLLVLFLVFFLLGSVFVADVMPDLGSSEPGLVSPEIGLLIISLANSLLVGALILTLRWTGWKLALSLALAYYGAVTFLMQIETWYFLSEITVGSELLPLLFLMGIPPAFMFIPLAVWILRKWRTSEEPLQHSALVMPLKQWVWKLAVIAVMYLILYWLAGYFIAWGNPELRSFYGHPGEAEPFFTHTLNTLRDDPLLFPFQMLRGLLWTACALPILLGSKVVPLWTAVLVGLLFSVPQNLGHILPNPLLPLASVRLSHLIETASSTFLFGMGVVWLLHREHDSIKDLFGSKRKVKEV